MDILRQNVQKLPLNNCPFRLRLSCIYRITRECVFQILLEGAKRSERNVEQTERIGRRVSRRDHSKEHRCRIALIQTACIAAPNGLKHGLH